MTFTAISDGQLTTDEPADSALFTALVQRDNHNFDEAPAAGGIAPTADAFAAAFVAHSHDGTAGQGEPVGSPGIATSGIAFSDEIASGAVTHAKLALSSGAGMDSANFANGSATPEKFTGALGARFTGSTAASNDTYTINHGLGRRPVVVALNGREFEIRSTSSSTIVVGLTQFFGADPYSWDFWAL